MALSEQEGGLDPHRLLGKHTCLQNLHVYIFSTCPDTTEAQLRKYCWEKDSHLPLDSRSYTKLAVGELFCFGVLKHRSSSRTQTHDNSLTSTANIVIEKLRSEHSAVPHSKSVKDMGLCSPRLHMRPENSVGLM